MRFNEFAESGMGFSWEGARGTSGIRFRDCYQDAGFPCAFQVFRPFQPLHTPVSPPSAF